MKQDDACEQCRLALIEFSQNELGLLERQLVDKHLAHCEQCSDALAELWQLDQMASQWVDASVPKWNRRRHFFESSPWPLRLQFFCTAASVAALVLVLSVSWLTLSTDHESVTMTQVDERLRSHEQQQKNVLNGLRTSQLVSNQLLVRNVMDRNREERRDEMAELVLLLEELQAQRAQSTQENLRYLLVSQAEDRRKINALSDVVTVQPAVQNRNF